MFVQKSPVGAAERRPNADRSAATRAALIGAGRELFTERGYAGVGTEEIVRRAQVTRGALYHHFADKRDLFRAVHELVEQEMVEAIVKAMEGVEDPVELLLVGARRFLDLCMEPEWTRIPLMDAPSVLGWAEWREIDQRYGLGIVTTGLTLAMDAGALRRQPVPPLAHILLASMGEAALMIASAESPKTVRAEVEAALVGLIEALRA
ncbi:MAG: TetR/AcrR family transcriptional regulator [Actinomycetota bacterium]|nr:TetR/AcrR family transcriptional regulator [Actinomycetota bacterium]